MVRIKLSKTLKAKIIVHGFQSIIIALNTVLTFAVLFKRGTTDGRVNFAIALVCPNWWRKDILNGVLRFADTDRCR